MFVFSGSLQTMSHLLTPAYTYVLLQQVPVTPSAAEYRRYSSLSTHSDEARIERTHGSDVTADDAAGRSRRATVSSSQPVNHSTACCHVVEYMFVKTPTALHAIRVCVLCFACACGCVFLVCVVILTVVARL